MSFEKSNTTTTLEKPTKDRLAELVDKKVEQNNAVSKVVDEVERETERFDTSHTVEGLHTVYNQIDRDTIARATGKEDIETSIETSDDSVSRIKRSKTYQDVVQTFESPTLEIDEVKISKKSKLANKSSKKISSRMKLWIGTGACCLILLVGLVICNALSIGAIERQTSMTESNLMQQEMVLEDLNSSISVESGKIPDNMKEILENEGTIDCSPRVDTEVVTSDNFFNRLVKFISYLFGR